MRELKNQEIAAVSGAGIFADTGSALGGQLGKVLEGFGLVGASKILTEIGNGIGQAIDMFKDISGIFGSIFKPKH